MAGHGRSLRERTVALRRGELCQSVRNFRAENLGTGNRNRGWGRRLVNKEEVRGVAGYRKEQPISSVLFSCKNEDHAEHIVIFKEVSQILVMRVNHERWPDI